MVAPKQSVAEDDGIPKSFKIAESGDWARLGDSGADLVLDPIVLRTAHLFLLGRRGTKNDPDRVREAVEANIGALATFVDAIILRERIPVFNYGNSFDLGPPPGVSPVWKPEPAELLRVCGEALIPVHISLKNEPDQGEYFALVKDAHAQASEHAEMPPALVREIVGQLESYDYTWEPRQTANNALAPVVGRYGELSGAQTDTGIVRRYLMGCFIFSGFAQRMGGEHLTPPGWSKLYAATALPLGPQDEAGLAEAALFRRLAEAGNTNHLAIGRTVEFTQPTFLPYLLDREDTKTPETLLRRAIELRQDDHVQQYRDFRREVRETAARGQPETHLREIDELVAAVERAVSKSPRRWPIKLRASLSFPGLAAGGAEAGKEIDLFRPYDWSMRQLPKNGYRKLLFRLVVSQQQTSLLKELVRGRWEAD
jgi:hypothetical protein